MLTTPTHRAINMHPFNPTNQSNNINAIDDLGREQLFNAVHSCQLSVVKKYLADGADLSVVDEKGYTVLHWAVMQPKNVAIAEFLIQQGLDVNQRNIEGDTPLDLVYQEHCYGMAKTLLKHGARFGSDAVKNSFISRIVQYRQKDLLCALIVMGFSMPKTYRQHEQLGSFITTIRKHLSITLSSLFPIAVTSQQQMITVAALPLVFKIA